MQLFDYINNLDFNNEIIKSFIICVILTTITLSSVIVIGYLIDKLELVQINFLSKFLGQRVAYFVTNYFMIPGVIIHELSHAFFAWLSGAKVTKIRCFEVFNKERLGSVEFYLVGNKVQQRIQLSMISCAPVVIGLILEYFLILGAFSPNLGNWTKSLLWYLIIAIGDHMSMSSVDIDNYKRGLVALIPLTFAIFWLLRYLLY